MALHPAVERWGADPFVHWARRGGAAADGAAAAAGPGPVDGGEPMRWLPPRLRSRIGRARARVSARRRGTAYETVRAHLDIPFYLVAHPELLRAEGLDPVAHFCRSGARRNRAPVEGFSPARYRERYDDAGGGNPFVHWLREGRAAGRTAHPFRAFDALAGIVGLTPGAAFERLARRRADLRARLLDGALGEQAAAAAALEPLVAGTWPEAFRVRLPPFSHDHVAGGMVALDALQREAGLRPARRVIVVGRTRWGGGRRLEGHLAHAFADALGAQEVVVVVTDGGDADGWGRGRGRGRRGGPLPARHARPAGPCAMGRPRARASAAGAGAAAALARPRDGGQRQLGSLLGRDAPPWPGAAAVHGGGERALLRRAGRARRLDGLPRAPLRRPRARPRPPRHRQRRAARRPGPPLRPAARRDGRGEWGEWGGTPDGPGRARGRAHPPGRRAARGSGAAAAGLLGGAHGPPEARRHRLRGRPVDARDDLPPLGRGGDGRPPRGGARARQRRAGGALRPLRGSALGRGRRLALHRRMGRGAGAPAGGGDDRRAGGGLRRGRRGRGPGRGGGARRALRGGARLPRRPGGDPGRPGGGAGARRARARDAARGARRGGVRRAGGRDDRAGAGAAGGRDAGPGVSPDPRPRARGGDGRRRCQPGAHRP